MRVDIQPHEVEALMMIDATWRNHHHETTNPDKTLDDAPLKGDRERSGLARGLDALIALRDANSRPKDTGKKG